MTETESKINDARNEVMRKCDHNPEKMPDGSIGCLVCGGRFVLVLLPVLSPVPRYIIEEEE